MEEQFEVVAFLMKPDFCEPYVGLHRDSMSSAHCEPLVTAAGANAALAAKAARIAELEAEIRHHIRVQQDMVMDIVAVGEALGIQGEDQEGGVGEFIELIEAMRAKPSPEPVAASQGEEGPEAVAYRSGKSGLIYEEQYGYLEHPEPLMTIAQHERIVAAKDAENMLLRDSMTFRTSLIGRLEAERDQLRIEAADGWEPCDIDYDRGIHHNPDAMAWADLFVATFPRLADKHDLMLGWFANAMMAMHDHLAKKDRAQAGGEVTTALPDGWRIELGFDVLDRLFRFVESKSHTPTIKIILPACEVDDSSAWDFRDEVASRIKAALAPAAVVMPDKAIIAQSVDLDCTLIPGSTHYNAAEYAYDRIADSLNRRAIPAGMLEKLAHCTDPDCCIAYWRDELRVLLGKSE